MAPKEFTCYFQSMSFAAWFRATLPITAITLWLPCASAAPILVTDFNLVVGGNLTSNSEVEGRTLVGGSLFGSASNYAVKLTPSADFSAVDTLIVGGNIAAGNVNVAAGDVRVGGTASGNVNLNGPGGELFQNDGTVGGMVASAIAGLNSLSAYLSGLTANSSVVDPAGPSAVTFNAVAGPGNVAVFNVDGSIFSDPNSQQLDLNLNAGVNALVFNVSGALINFNQGNFVGGFLNPSIRPQIIWNFAGATGINLDRNWFGALLAPNANLTNSTAIEGSVYIGGNFDQRGEVHLPLYESSIPGSAVPEPSSIFLILTGISMALAAKRLRYGPASAKVESAQR